MWQGCTGNGAILGRVWVEHRYRLGLGADDDDVFCLLFCKLNNIDEYSIKK